MSRHRHNVHLWDVSQTCRGGVLDMSRHRHDVHLALLRRRRTKHVESHARVLQGRLREGSGEALGRFGEGSISSASSWCHMWLAYGCAAHRSGRLHATPRSFRLRAVS